MQMAVRHGDGLAIIRVSFSRELRKASDLIDDWSIGLRILNLLRCPKEMNAEDNKGESNKQRNQKVKLSLEREILSPS